MLLRPAGLRAIEQPLGGYREPIPIPIDEFLFLGSVYYFVLYPALSLLRSLADSLGLPLRLIPHSAFRILQKGPASISLQKTQHGLNQIGGRLDVKIMPHPLQDFPFRPADGTVNLLSQMKGGEDIFPSGDNQGWKGDL